MAPAAASGPDSAATLTHYRARMNAKNLLSLLLIAALASPALAQTAQETTAQLRALTKSGAIDGARDIAPVIARIKASKKEAELVGLIKAVAEVAESDSDAPKPVRAYARKELSPLIVDFVRGPYSPGARDSVIMLLRTIDASDADTRSAIAVAEAEAAKGTPHFGNSARLLNGFLDNRGSAAPNAKSDPQPGAAATATAAAAKPPAKPAAKAGGAFDERYDSQMKAAQKAMSEKRYVAVKELVTELEKDLLREDPNYGDKVRWAYVFDFKRFALYEMGEQEAALASCRQAVTALASNDWPYLSEYNAVRAARRACHNMLAYEQSAVATTVAQHEAAIEQIEECFDTISPIEDASALDNFYETRATVYLKANKVTKNKYQPQLFDTLLRADARKLALDEDPEFSKIMKTPAYLDFKKNAKKQAANKEST